MIEKIVRGYGKIFLSAIKIIALVALCFALGSAFVYPLWKFATELPSTYTLTMILILCATVIFYSIKKTISMGFKPMALFFAKFVILASGIFACIFLILSGKRFFSIPIILVMIILYGILAFARDNKKTTEHEEPEIQ